MPPPRPESRGDIKCDRRGRITPRHLPQKNLNLRQASLIPGMRTAASTGGWLSFLSHKLAASAAALMALALSFCASSASAGSLKDAKPNDRVATAHTMPIQGIDVSYWQGDIDWEKVRDAGVSFTYIKATEGGDRIDPKFLENWEGAKRAGIARGAYHFIYWC